MRILLTILILTGFSLVLTAQDQIIKRNGEIIHCKVMKVQTLEISYTLEEFGPDVEFQINKIEVKKIVFANGSQIDIDYMELAKESIEGNSAILFEIQNRNAIKLDIFNILLGTTAVSYERALKPAQSIEFELGFIGLGFTQGGIGLGLKAAYKFFVAPDFFIDNMRYSHILKGPYIRPEIAIAMYDYESEGIVFKGAAMISFGAQWVMGDRFLFDLYYSLGMGGTTGEDYDMIYFEAASGGAVLSEAYGARIGFLF